jgi:PAS domain S-box-containing protein
MKSNSLEHYPDINELNILQCFLHSSILLTISTLHDGRIIDISEGIERLIGYQREEIIGRTAFEFGFWPEAAERDNVVLQLLDNRSIHDVEISYITKSGDLCFGMLSADVVKLGGEECMVSIIRDITEQKRIQEQLSEKEDFSSNLLTNAPIPMWVSNPDYSIKYVNPALERLTGFSSSDLVGKKPPYPFWTEETSQQSWKNFRIAKRKGLKKVEYLFKKKGGERFWVEIHSVPIKRNGKLLYYLSNWVDITESKRLNDDIKFYIRQVTVAQEEERRRIARDLHDETAQTLASLSFEVGNVAMTKQLPTNTNERLKYIQDSIAALVERVKRFSHDLRPGLLDRFGLIPSLELLIEETEAHSRLNCRIEVVGSERRLSPDTELGLFRIVQEALNNVRKHSKATETIIRIQFMKTRIRLQISDNGVGFEVPAEFSILARKGKLGLMGINERVHLLNGVIRLKSSKGQGAKLTVEVSENNN